MYQGKFIHTHLDINVPCCSLCCVKVHDLRTQLGRHLFVHLIACVHEIFCYTGELLWETIVNPQHQCSRKVAHQVVLKQDSHKMTTDLLTNITLKPSYHPHIQEKKSNHFSIKCSTIFFFSNKCESRWFREAKKVTLHTWHRCQKPILKSEKTNKQ